ncbi:MAG: DUF502 domain-containing protein [Rhodospirillales bacterium]|nr:DUF502 domain-containing protein [Rhodospirillales bacterium]MCB9996063.1 DUF502 domain-containing protein [Rhodospirillales bacterium]
MSESNKPKSVLDENMDGLQPNMFARLRAYFLAGILVTAPIGLTIFLTWTFLRFIDARVTALIPAHYNPFNYLPVSLPGLELVKALISLILVILFFIMIGWFARNFLGRLLYQMSEYVVHRMPVINTIYKAIKQIFETIMASQSHAFRDVVMLEYPRKGVWSLGFVTGRSEGEVQRTTAKETMSVFVPTTPNPTSGYLLFVPREELFFLDMTVEEAAKLIVSAGIIVPPDRTAKEKAVEKAPAKASAKKTPAKKAAAKKKPKSKS